MSTTCLATTGGQRDNFKTLFSLSTTGGQRHNFVNYFHSSPLVDSDTDFLTFPMAAVGGQRHNSFDPIPTGHQFKLFYLETIWFYVTPPENDLLPKSRLG